MKSVLLICQLLVLTSCYVQRSITQSDEAITKDVLNELRPGKKYFFHFKNEYVLKVEIEKIKNDTIFGDTRSAQCKTMFPGDNDKNAIKRTEELMAQPFQRSFGEIQRDTNKITKRTFSPVLTLIPVVSLTFIILSLDNVSMGSAQ